MCSRSRPVSARTIPSKSARALDAFLKGKPVHSMWADAVIQLIGVSTHKPVELSRSCGEPVLWKEIRNSFVVLHPGLVWALL